MTLRSTHRITGGLDAVLRAREVAIGVLVDRTNGPPRLVEDARLLVSELATNSLIHGGVQEDEEFILAIEVSDVIRIEVIDHGAGFAPSGSRAPQPAVGGYGLKLVERIAHRWGVIRARGYTHVWFELEPSAYIGG